MTVTELIKELQSIENQNRIVLISSDSEGNSIMKLQENSIDHTNIAISEDEGHYVETGLEELTDELRKQGYTVEDIAHNNIPAIVIYP